MISGVYIIKNVKNNKIYVGSTLKLDERWGKHLRDLKNGRHHNIHLQRAWDKYGEDGFVFEVLEYCEDILIREQHYLDSLKPYDSDKGYNICENATSPMLGRTHSVETKELLSEIFKGVPKPERSKKHKNNLSLAIKGRKLDSEWKDNISDGLKKRFGDGLTEEHKNKIAKSLSQNILVYDKNGNFVKEFENQKIAAKELKLSQGNISEVLNGKRKSTGGYVFQKKGSENE